jgi:hypothetical protein
MKNIILQTLLITATIGVPALPAFAQDINGNNLTLAGTITQNGSSSNFFNGSYSSFDGSMCVGNSCASSGEVNGSGNPPLKLKWSQADMIFEDTSSTSFPDRDWRIRINDSGPGQLERFSIVDEGPNWTLDTPVVPFTIVGGAPENAFWIDNTGDIGQGTDSPLAPLHIFRDNGTAQVLVEETSMAQVPRTLFKIASAGSNAKFEIENTLAGVNWAFTNAGTDFRISRQGSGTVEFQVFNNGDAFIAGDLDVGGNLLTNVLLPSDENIKQNIEAIDPQSVLEKVAALPVSTWEYRDRPGQQHLGPMAQDFHAAFGLGNDDTSISTVDASGVGLASIKALEARNRELESEVGDLREEVDQMRALLMQLLPQTARN